MALNAIGYTSVVLIMLLAISPGQAETVELDFQTPPSSPVNCEDDPNGISCIKIESNGLADSQENTHSTSMSRRIRSSLSDTQQGAKCLSTGGSNAAAGSVGGFCIASDLNKSATVLASFAVANETPVTGLQFLQVTLNDGSILVGSNELQDNETPMKAVCTSGGGSNAAAGNPGGFCLAADLTRDNLAAFSVANGLPVVGLQFLQVTFASTNPLTESVNGNTNDATKCISAKGSTATTGNAGGFCLASDLGASTTGAANFSVANSLPVEAIHFLQVSFEDNKATDKIHPGMDMPTAAECVSSQGSTAVTGRGGSSCLTSDLGTLTKGNANFSLANNLSISNMQSLQAVFGGDSQLSESQKPAGLSSECVSAKGSTATPADSKGFCLSSDHGASTMNFANFSMVNGLPISALRFMQIPDQPSSSGYLPNGDTPIGVAISSSDDLAIPVLKGFSDRDYHYFRIPQKESGIEIRPSLNQSGRFPPLFFQGR